MKLILSFLQSDSLYVALNNIANDTSSIITWQNSISAFLGGILVIAGHYLIERTKISKQNHQELISTISKLSEIKYRLRNLFRELAMYKTHANYWWFCTLKTVGPKADEHRQEHLRSLEEGREIEKQIGNNIAQFLGQITKFEILTDKKVDVSTWIEKIDNIEFNKARDYEESMTYDKVKNDLVEDDEKMLRQCYYENLGAFDKIISGFKNKL